MCFLILTFVLIYEQNLKNFIDCFTAYTVERHGSTSECFHLLFEKVVKTESRLDMYIPYSVIYGSCEHQLMYQCT